MASAPSLALRRSTNRFWPSRLVETTVALVAKQRLKLLLLVLVALVRWARRRAEQEFPLTLSLRARRRLADDAKKLGRQQEGVDAELRNFLRACFSAASRVASSEVRTEERLVVSASSSRGRECQLVCFASQRFSQLRALWGLDEGRYCASLSEQLQGGSRQTTGKSGSLSWTTADSTLVLKSIQRSELQTLLKGLARYEQHFSSNRNSLLSRFYGAYELQAERHRVTFVVMNSVFACSLEPHVVYDLKGTSEDRWVKPRPGVVLKDLNFADQIIGIPDLKKKAELMHAIKRDTQFLRNLNVMDYSLCLGVYYCAENALPSSEQITRPAGISSSLAVLPGFQPKYQCTLVRNQAAQRVVYFIGIIDILQEYTFVKALSHAVKAVSLGWVHEIDTAPPVYYARRFKTSFCGKVQTFREPEDRATRFVRRLRLGIDNGTVPCPTFATASDATDAVAVTLDEAVDFAVRCGGHLLMHRKGWLRSGLEEVEAFLDMDRHALIFQEMARRPFRERRPTSAIACYKIRRVYLSIVCHRPRDRYCSACSAQVKVEAEPPEVRCFTVEADDEEPLRFTAPSRRQAKLWVTALEASAGYVEANVEDVKEAAATVVGCRSFGDSGTDTVAPAVRAAVLGSLDCLLSQWEVQQVVCSARNARLGMLEPYLLGPEAERRWQKRRLKWIFSFVDMEGTGMLSPPKVSLLWREMNINANEGHNVLNAFLREEREGRRAGGGRQIGAGRVVQLADWVRLLRLVDAAYVRAVQSCVGGFLTQCHRRCFNKEASTEAAWNPLFADDVTVPADDLARFFTEVQQVWPPPSPQQVQRLASRLAPPLVTKQHSLSLAAFAQLLCSPGNALVDPAKRPVFQDMTQPLSAYFIETSHNTYLEGNQLSSRSSVLRYVEVLRQGCRSVEVDVWDGAEGEPVVKHGYTVTTEVLFQDVIQAIADHAFVASEYPVIISIEQHCSARQRLRQGEVMTELLGEQLLRPPWDEERGCIAFERVKPISPWSAKRRFLVKSSLGCCERCRGTLPGYDRCIALPTRKLLHKLLESEKTPPDPRSEDCEAMCEPLSSPRSPSSRALGCSCHVASGTATKVQKLEKSVGQEALRRWNSNYLSRVYPEGTRIGSGNVDPLPMWLCGVQMVAMNYQTSDTGLLLNEGLFRNYNGGCGYVLKPPGLQPSASPQPGTPDLPAAGKRLRLVVCCGHRLPRPEGSSSVSPPAVTVGLEPGAQISQTPCVSQDGYHPVFNHEVELLISESPLHILMFEVRDSQTSRLMARNAVTLDAVREGFRWLALQSTNGNTIPHCGLLLFVQFLS
eukprot:TRINITY_DN35766_c0_g1_i1.p1 TRINITY_DN35766_c0_g1~~TRINITY_DN35766_c0_g1_i1.p1  ORF type:complete len:1316 (-),score=248.67 TRINITY_DN35766_c0_g1_i1:36-3956(-)